jgi:hypothetical protein
MERTRNMEPFSFAEAYRTCARHYKEGNLNWPMIIYISLAHVAALFGIFSLQYCAKYTLLWAFICWPISGLGITAGAHRLWAHRSYKATFALRTFLMLANSMANQGSIWHWSRDHRVHHKHSESSADPHDATRGMFFAHMGWLFVKKHPAVVEAGKTLSFDDLKADPLVVFQKTCDPWFALFMCFVFPGLVCMLWGATSYRNEVQALSLLKRAEVTHVPRILTWLDDLGAPQTTDGEAVLLVSPVGRPVANVKATMNRISGRNLVQLIAVLQKAHGLGLRHRDIKPENIFLDEDGNLVLIDWGCSVINCQQPIPWAGTRLYATPVPGLHAHIPTPEDDLKLAIRSAFVLATAWLPLHPSDESWITAMGTNTFWEEMSQFARFGNYDKLSDLLAKMIGTLSEVKFAEK